MLKLEADAGRNAGKGFVSCEIDGKIADIIRETLAGLQAVYRNMNGQCTDQRVLAYFRREIIRGVTDPESKVWSIEEGAQKCGED